MADEWKKIIESRQTYGNEPISLLFMIEFAGTDSCEPAIIKEKKIFSFLNIFVDI